MELVQTLEKSRTKDCIIEIFGLGYVGFPLLVRLAKSGFTVRGIDINPQRIERLKNNILMESEMNLKNEFLQSKENSKIILAQSPEKSDQPKIAIISVPTPIPSQDNPSNIFVKSAVQRFLETSKPGDIIIIESSIEVGTTDEIRRLIEGKGFRVGTNYGLSFCPERIDPQNKKWTLENIPRVIYSSDDVTFQIIQKVYQNVNNANLVRVSSPLVAEVVKSFENAFRLVNISLVNELAILCDKLKINVKDVIDAASTKPFGFIPFYPGAGAGGHCIPKDPKFLLESAKKFGFDFTTIQNAIMINNYIPYYISNEIQKIIEENNLKKSIIVCGLSYKPDMEDMRDSPGFKIISELVSRNFKVVAYDPYFKEHLREKYLIENHLTGLEFEIAADLNDHILQQNSCLCIVQHHTSTKFRLDEIYEKDLVPIIYDCQSKMIPNPHSKTILRHLGGNKV